MVAAALRRGLGVAAVHAATLIDPWFLSQIELITEAARGIAGTSLDRLSRSELRHLKRLGFSDPQLADLLGCTEAEIFDRRVAEGIVTTFKTVDTCAAEFEAFTPYHFGTFEEEDEVATSDKRRIIILGSGPNRIGQGIEFDYCCVHASMALRAAGFETIMVNCNPETVSTDYDTSDRLYFEPLTREDVLAIIAAEQRQSVDGGELVGVIVSLGGQTPLKLSHDIPEGLVLGTSPSSIDLAEDRKRFNDLLERHGMAQPPGGTATTLEGARAVAATVGYPALVRPSYVLGGRAMEIVYDDAGLSRAMDTLLGVDGADGALAREGGVSEDRPILIDRFLEEAIEVDVDTLRDATGATLVGGVMEHVEEAGVHSGDSACALPPQTLSDEVVATLEQWSVQLAEALEVVGLLNVQFAVKDGEVFVIEANPRASRTVPFVAKATGVPLAAAAARLMAGATLAELRAEGMVPGERIVPEHVSVKEAVLPFGRFPGVDTLLGPEMRSTGEVMGVDRTFGLAFAKSQMAAGSPLPSSGMIFLSLADRDKGAGAEVAASFRALGFEIAATVGTAGFLRDQGIEVAQLVAKVGEDGPAADAVALIATGRVQLVINTPRGRGPRADGAHIRAASVEHLVPCLTTLAAARAAAQGIGDGASHPLEVVTLQGLHRASFTP